MPYKNSLKVSAAFPGFEKAAPPLEGNYFRVISRMVLSPMISRISKRLTAI